MRARSPSERAGDNRKTVTTFLSSTPAAPRVRMAITPHSDEGIPRDDRETGARLDERVTLLERRLEALEDTVRSLALDLQRLYEGADTDEELT